MQPQELAQTPFVLLLLRISVFASTSICIFSFLYFSAISFVFMGILPTLEISHDVSVPLTITIQQIGLVPEYHLYFSVSPQVCCAVSVKPQ